MNKLIHLADTKASGLLQGGENPASLGTQLKCLYTHSMGNKQDELETCMPAEL